MPVEMGLWCVDDEPVRLLPGMPTEARLEELIEAEPTILGEPLLIIGRQVATSFGKIIDLAVGADGLPVTLAASLDHVKTRQYWVIFHARKVIVLAVYDNRSASLMDHPQKGYTASVFATSEYTRAPTCRDFCSMNFNERKLDA